MNGRHRAVQARRRRSWRIARPDVVPIVLIIVLVLLATFAQTAIAQRAVDALIAGR